MRELERDHSDATNPSEPALAGHLAILGAGRAGGSIAGAARDAGLDVDLGAREVDLRGAGILLICVPDSAIRATCERIVPAVEPDTLVGHVSGASPLDALEAAAAAGHETFSLHPLQTIPTNSTDLGGAPCAVSGSTPGASRVATALASRLGMQPFEVPEEGRAAYHAAASMASNLLIALEESAADLMKAAGVPNAREVLAPLVLRSAANWADAGAEALTGPIARGDEATVALHLEALATTAPELRPLYEALAERTRSLGAEQ
ncbi:MAG TPA: DUF2520 domain-containing protein [Solirubrobacterales bacterium]|nr:DUF2520 domain-containing protein [Solirubrobacterales bacterium]